jgi:hypothetical protein
MCCSLLDLNNGKLSPLTPGATHEVDKYGRYDVKCEMDGAEFVKFHYNNNVHDAWDPPFVFSGVPDADPGCNERVKFLSGGCGATCSGTKSITAAAQQISNDICLEYSFHFKCSHPEPEKDDDSDDSDDEGKDYDKKKYWGKKDDDSDDEGKDYDKKKYGDKKDDSDDEGKD